MNTKICAKCKKEKSISDFSFKNKEKGFLQSRCKECKKDESHNHYDKNKKYYKNKAALKSKSVRGRNLQYVIDYLKEHPCVDCGEKDPIVLEFDHIKDKYMNISKMIDSHSLSLIKLEIEKCDVRCANCHRIKTAKQLNWYKDVIL